MPEDENQDVSSTNLTGRAGRWSARHRKVAIWGWIAFVVAAVAIGGAVGMDVLRFEDAGTGESGRADRTLSAAFEDSSAEQVLVQSGELTAEDPAFRATVRDVIATLGGEPHVEEVRSPYRSGEISADGRSALVGFELAGDTDEAEDRVDSVLAAIAGVDDRHGELRVEQFGEASLNKGITENFEDDFQQAEALAPPIILAILILAFGALVAAGIPLLLAVTAVAATIGLLGPVSHLVALNESVQNVVFLIGLAVGVDYTLFYLRREREERARGASERAALETAAATSGRAVLVSGLTVIIAMAGMFLGGSQIWSAFAIGTILVVAVAVVGSLTVLPGVLAWLGDRVEKLRVPVIGKMKGSAGESRVWGWVLDRVLRRPVVAAVLAAGALLAIAVPVLGLKTAVPGADALPRDISVMQTFDRVQEAFPGSAQPATVVVTADDVRSPDVSAAIADLRAAAVDTDGFEEPVTTRINGDGTVAAVDLPMAGDGGDDRAFAALADLREEIIPATLAQPGISADVTGVTAGNEDFSDLMQSRIAWVFAFVLGMAFLLLLVTFRSIVIPTVSILLNLLSVGAAYGLLVLIFQDGRLEGLLGFESTGAITTWLPLFLFVVLFGLSMDYQVFILSRIREAVDRGVPTTEAVSDGIRSTAGVVTSAAAIMVGVFAVFASLSSVEFKQMGIGLAAAILIDATVIRGVLLPAVLNLLGERSWYLPRSLDWLPRVSAEPPPQPAEEPA